MLPLMPGVPERHTHDYVRNGTTNRYAALDLTSGQVIADMSPRHRAEEFRRFLNTIDATVPAHLDVHVVLDNSSTHKTPQIQRWLVRHPRFTLHFTPTYSSWLNLVERWFAELTTKWIKRGTSRLPDQPHRWPSWFSSVKSPQQTRAIVISAVSPAIKAFAVIALLQPPYAVSAWADGAFSATCSSPLVPG